MTRHAQHTLSPATPSTAEPDTPAGARPVRSSASLAPAALTVASIVMVCVGWRERTPVQSALLGLSNLPLSAAAALVLQGVVRRHADVMPASLPRLTRVAAAPVGLGLALYVIAYTVGPVALAPLGQFFIWMSLAALFTVVLVALVSARTARPVELRQLRRR